MFGSLPLTYSSTPTKIHESAHPARVVITKLFPAQRHGRMRWTAASLPVALLNPPPVPRLEPWLHRESTTSVPPSPHRAVQSRSSAPAIPMGERALRLSCTHTQAWPSSPGGCLPFLTSGVGTPLPLAPATIHTPEPLPSSSACVQRLHQRCVRRVGGRLSPSSLALCRHAAHGAVILQPAASAPAAWCHSTLADHIAIRVAGSGGQRRAQRERPPLRERYGLTSG